MRDKEESNSFSEKNVENTQREDRNKSDNFDRDEVKKRHFQMTESYYIANQVNDKEKLGHTPINCVFVEKREVDREEIAYCM